MRILKIVGLTVLVILLLAGIAAGILTRPSSLDDRLVADAKAIDADDETRPTHVDPALPGSFGEALLPALNGLKPASEALSSDDAGQKILGDVLKGTRPLADLPPAVLALVTPAHASIATMLAATHTAKAKGVPSMRTFSFSDRAMPQNQGMWVIAGTKLAGVEIDQQLAKGDPSAALAECIDALAVGRDLSWEMGLIGPMMGAAVVQNLAEPCAAAIDAAPLDRKKAAVVSLGRIRDGFAPMSHALKQDAVRLELETFGVLLSASRREALPPAAREALAQSNRPIGWNWVKNLPDMVIMRDAWKVESGVLDQSIAAADLPREERDTRNAAASNERENSWNPLVRIASPDMVKFLRRNDRSLALLNLLQIAAASDAFRAEKGAWPRSVDDLVAAKLLASAQKDSRTGQVPAIASTGETATIPAQAVPMSLSATQNSGSDLVFVMHVDK